MGDNIEIIREGLILNRNLENGYRKNNQEMYITEMMDKYAGKSRMRFICVIMTYIGRGCVNIKCLEMC